MKSTPLRTLNSARSKIFAIQAILITGLLLIAARVEAVTNSWVYFDANGKLAYRTWGSGNRIMDFSHAGYQGGGVPIPTIAAVQTLNPSGGDDRTALQNAINAVASRPLVNGSRGALQLGPGTFLISGQINLNASGVVVRGSGSGVGGTILVMTNAASFTLLNIAGSGSPSQSGKVSITDSYVPSGTTNFTVNNASGYNVGDTVIIGRTVTTNWIHYMGMDTLVRSGVTQTWISAGTVITTDRKIKQISGNQIGLDAPLTDSFDTNYVGIPAGTLSHYTWLGRISQVGLENLKIVAPPVVTGYAAITIDNVIDSWLRNVAVQDGVNCISLSKDTKQMTIDHVTISHTVISTASAAPTDFAVTGTQILLNKCQTFGTGSWAYVTHTTGTGPIVLLNCTTTQDRGVAPHQRWSTGLLADNCQFPNAHSSGDKTGVAFINRTTDGSGHGWTMGWGVAWNVITPSFSVCAAPGTENWCIGGIGARVSTAFPDGIFEALGSIVTPRSLYLAQLVERLGGAAVENTGYPLFTISNSPASRIITAGTNTTYTVIVGDPSLMSNVVALSVSGLPANASASFSTNAVKGTGNATLTVTASNAIATGTYMLNVIGTSAGLSHTSTVSFAVGNFALGVNPPTASVLAGASTNYTVTLTTNSGFSGSVDLGVDGLPVGASGSFVPGSLNGNGNATLNIATGENIAPGNYPLTIYGTNAGTVATATVTLAITSLTANPGVLVWTNGAADINWSSVLNWTNVTSGGYGPPGIANDVVFTNFSTAATIITVDNIVNGDASVASLTYENTNSFHTTQIAPGKTLTIVGGGLLAGTETDAGTTATVTASITGAGGSLVVSNAAANLIVRQGGTNGGSGMKAILDMSGLDTFQATVARVEIGAFGTYARPSGTLNLAKTNFIAASGASPAIQVGGQGGGSGNGGNGSFFYLGQSNVIFANGITVAAVKQTGCSMLFGPGVATGNPTAYFRGANGVGPVPNWFIADSGSQGGTVNTSGTNDFSGGTVDALVGNLTIARSSTGSGLGNPVGTLTFDGGLMNIGTLQIAVQGLSSANVATGTANVNGSAQLMVSTNLELAHVVGGTGAATTTGRLNVNGGAVQATNIFGGGGIAIINLNSGTIDLLSGRVANITTLGVGAAGVGNPAVLTSAATINVSNTIAIAANGVIAGNTVITSPGLTVNGTLSPGVNGVGGLTNNGPTTFGAGGHLAMDIQNAVGAPGVDWDFLSLNGALDIQSFSTNPFTIDLQSVSANDSDGLTNFNFDTPFDWTITTATNLTNFVAGNFAVNSSQFGDDLAGGYFYVRSNSNSLVLSFTNNHPPSAGTNLVYRAGDVTVIPIASLAVRWSDPDGDPVTLMGVNGSTNGAGVGADANFIYYTNFNGAADVISYTVADVRTNPPAIYRPGDTVRTAVGNIVILPAPALGGLNVSGTNLIFRSSNGIPGAPFSILASTNMNLPIENWPVIQTGAFDGNGMLQSTNAIDPNAPQMFYLLRLQ